MSFFLSKIHEKSIFRPKETNLNNFSSLLSVKIDDYNFLTCGSTKWVILRAEGVRKTDKFNHGHKKAPSQTMCSSYICNNLSAHCYYEVQLLKKKRWDQKLFFLEIFEN